MANHNGVFASVERKAEIASTTPQRHSHLRAVAESLSRRNADQATLELFNEAMQRLTLLCYEQDAGYCNIDPVTQRILLPLPWGRAGHRRWGLTSTESVILRAMIQQRQAQVDFFPSTSAGKKGERPPGLWLYERTRRCWRLNLFDFDRLADAQRYWQQWPLSIGEYRAARRRRLGGL